MDRKATQGVHTHKITTCDRECLSKRANVLDIPPLDHAGEVAVELWVCEVPARAHLVLSVVLEKTVETLDSDAALQAYNLRLLSCEILQMFI